MANIRQGIPHLFSTKTTKGNLTPSISDYDFQKIIENGKVSLRNVTEKTDGQTMIIGYDHDGFYTRSSGTSDIRVRDGAQYITRARQRGNSIEAACAFGEFHHALRRNKDLQERMAEWRDRSIDKQIAIRGEVFNRQLVREVDGYFIKFVHTFYDSRAFGEYGAFIVHHALPDNAGTDFLNGVLKEISNSDVVFDHDRIDINEDLHVSWDYSREDLHRLIHNRLDKIKPKWGYETEGWVVHSKDLRVQPVFKVVSDKFKKAKEQSNGW